MTIPEATQLVIQAGAIAKGGEIFVLDMGEPVKIYDLAIDLIRLSGLVPKEDIDIEVTGLRPGEKLFEELLMEEEGLINTKYPKIFIGSPGNLEYAVLKKSLQELQNEVDKGTRASLIEMISLIVPTYKCSEDVNDQDQDTYVKESINKYRTAEV